MGVPINNVTRRVVYAASGTGPYNFTFEILAAADIAVYRDDTLLTLTTDYTVTINVNGTGFVTLTATPTGATQIAIVGNRTISRTSDFVTGGDFFANTLNDELDQQTIFNQQNAEGLSRSLQAPQTDPTTINMTLPRAATRANKTLAFDANGNPTTGISAADIANASTYATNAANSATAAAASASSASSSASSASGSASTASTAATNASNSASSASTSASNASTSASNAATSETNAASSASSASTSASSASTSASNASTSATNAASSASSAAASAASALAALDSFDDRYLGAKTSDPTLDNDGNALVAGALYFNSVDGVMKLYTGSAWIAAYVSGTASNVGFTPADSIAATNVQTAIQELDTEKVPRTSTTGSALVPSGTQAQRDGSPAAGYFRFNSDVAKFEGYNGSAWGSVGGGATGGGSDDIFIENGQTVTANYTLTTGKNAGSFGPITINSGVTVTVPSGQVWSIV